jgi:hypothetical protein
MWYFKTIILKSLIRHQWFRSYLVTLSLYSAEPFHSLLFSDNQGFRQQNEGTLSSSLWLILSFIQDFLPAIYKPPMPFLKSPLKGVGHKIFSVCFFSQTSFLLRPWEPYWSNFKFAWKFVNISECKGKSPVSTNPAINEKNFEIESLSIFCSEATWLQYTLIE